MSAPTATPAAISHSNVGHECSRIVVASSAAHDVVALDADRHGRQRSGGRAAQHLAR
jgi:hypothetical protein